jgi:hypothetical protein
MTTTISLVVPPLTDNTIAFANAAAWNSYWTNISGDAEFDALTVTAYGPTPTSYNSALQPHSLTVDAQNYVFPTLAQFDSLKNAFNALQTSYLTLRSELYAQGLIDNL